MTEFQKELLKLKNELNRVRNRIGISRSEDRFMKLIMSGGSYWDKQLNKDSISDWAIKCNKVHELFDKIGTSPYDRKQIWDDHFYKIKSYSGIYDLKPIKEGRDNKDIRVGSGYSQRGAIRFPRKGHKNAWKKFYKLFPRLDPNNKTKLTFGIPPEAEKILNKNKYYEKTENDR